MKVHHACRLMADPYFRIFSHHSYLAKIGLKSSHFKSTNQNSFSGIPKLNTEILSVFYEDQPYAFFYLSWAFSQVGQSSHSSPTDFLFHPQRQLLQTSGSLLNFPSPSTNFTCCRGPHSLPYLEDTDHTTWTY